MTKWLNLVWGSIAGGFSRYLLAGLIQQVAGAGFPYGTLVVNLSGCLLIGYLDALAEVRFILGPDARMLLMTGFCGAYTTFSTYILETSHLIRDGQLWRALVNIMVSVAAGLLLFQSGYALGRNP